MNDLHNMANALEHGHNIITLDPVLADAARKPIERMLDFAATNAVRVQASGDIEKDMKLYSNVGAA